MRDLKLLSQVHLLGVLIFIIRIATLESADWAINHASIAYFEQSPYNFFMAENMTFLSMRANSVIKGLNFCKCQAACTAAGSSCHAWSVITLKKQKTTECRLTNSGPENQPPFPKEGATYFFKESSIDGTYSWQLDHLLYVELKRPYIHEWAVKKCANIPGHRLIIIKIQPTFDYFASLSLLNKNEKPWYAANLKKINQSHYVWGDGTSYADTELTSAQIKVDDGPNVNIFISHSGVLDDKLHYLDGPFRTICQANPIGIEW